MTLSRSELTRDGTIPTESAALSGLSRRNFSPKKKSGSPSTSAPLPRGNSCWRKTAKKPSSVKAKPATISSPQVLSAKVRTDHSAELFCVRTPLPSVTAAATWHCMTHRNLNSVPTTGQIKSVKFPCNSGPEVQATPHVRKSTRYSYFPISGR